MKPHGVAERFNKQVEDDQTVKMTIDADGMDFIMQRLTNLYSTPALAVLREYLSNAIDSHVKSGTTAPVKVHIPTTGGSSFDKGASLDLIIEDFGLGLSEDEIRNIYARYGASTKRDSNLEMGGFGLGCKSALAVTDSFMLYAVKDGVRTVANVGKTETGSGFVRIQSSEPTDAQNGVKVVIPIPVENVRNLYTESNLGRFGMKMFAGFSNSQVDVVFGTAKRKVVFENVHDKSFNQITNGSGLILGWVSKEPTKPRTVTNYGRSTAEKIEPNVTVLVGGVSYVVKLDEVKDDSNIQKLAKYNYDVYLNLPIGSVELTPSREDFIYSARTINAISAVAEQTSNIVASQVLAKIGTQATRKGAAIAYGMALQNSFWMHKDVRWQGEVIPTIVDLEGFSKIVRTPKKRAAQYHSKAGSELSLQIWYESKNYGVKVGNSNSSEIVHGVEKRITQMSKMFLGEDSNHSFTVLIQNDAVDNKWVTDAIIYRTLSEIDEELKTYRANKREAAKAANGGVTATATSKQSKTSNYFVFDCSEPIPTRPDNRTAISLKLQSVHVSTLNAKDVLYVHASETSISALKNSVPTSFPSQKDVEWVREYTPYLSEFTKYFPDKKLVMMKGNQSLAKFKDALGEGAQEAGAAMVAKLRTESADATREIMNYKIAVKVHDDYYLSSFVVFLNLLTKEEQKTLPTSLANLLPYVTPHKPALSNLNDRLKKWGIKHPSVDEMATEKFKELKKVSTAYPLLASMHSGEGMKKNKLHILDYVRVVPPADNH